MTGAVGQDIAPRIVAPPDRLLSGLRVLPVTLQLKVILSLFALVAALNGPS